MKWEDLMIDVESAGVGDHGALLSIGAAFFDLQTCTIGPKFSRAINLATAVRNGGQVDPATFIFWMGASQEARDAIRFSTEDIAVVLTDFAAFIAEHSRVQDVRPYGNSARFDLAKIDNAYQSAGIKTPWRFGNERCFRTVRNMYPSVLYDWESKGDSAHTAIVDAEFQISHMFKIKNRNRHARV